MTEIAGKTVLITGGASGIGRLVALEMAGQGGRVVVWDIQRPALDGIVEELGRAGRERAWGYVCDVSKRDEVRATAGQVVREVGEVDILVNNAGVVSGKTLLEIRDEEIQATFAVNTLALFWTTRAFLPAMVAANRGHVVTVASAAGLLGVAGLTDYCASKWAAVGFDESLRMELRNSAPGVRTTVVCPFFVDTGLFEGVQTRFPFLLPILSGDYVARRIVGSVRRNRRRLILPRFAYTSVLIRALPVTAVDAIAEFFGINTAMKHFVGRGV